MRKYYDNDKYPSPSPKKTKAAPSFPSVEDSTKTQSVKAGEVNTDAQGNIVGKKAKVKLLMDRLKDFFGITTLNSGLYLSYGAFTP